MKLISILLIFFLFSCTHKVKVSTKSCKTTGIYSETNAQYKTISENYLFFGYEKEFSLNKLLVSNNIQCRNIKFLSYVWKQGPIDSLISIIPFVNQKTLVVSYSIEK